MIVVPGLTNVRLTLDLQKPLFVECCSSAIYFFNIVLNLLKIYTHANKNASHKTMNIRGGSRIFGKGFVFIKVLGFHIYKGMGVRFADIISLFI